MPQEGVTLTVEVATFGSLWSDLERALAREPVPWREASKYLTKRAKQPVKLPGQLPGK